MRLDGDFNYDNRVDFADLVSLAQNYGASLTLAQMAAFEGEFSEDLARAAAQVPEPAAVGLLAVGAILAGRRRGSMGSMDAASERARR